MFWRTKPGWFGKQLEKNIEILRGGDLTAIPWIFCVLSEEHEHSKWLAAQMLSQLLDTLNFDEIIRLDEQMRQTTSMEWNIDWRAIRLDSLFTQDMTAEQERAVVIFSSFSPNGYIREQAVKSLPSHSNTLPYILLRQNDWVMQVRQAASAAFEQKIEKLDPGELLMALPFADKLSRGLRGCHSQQLQHFFEKLMTPDHSSDLMGGLKSCSIRTRRICIHALLNSESLNLECIFMHLKREREPFLRSIIFKELMAKNQEISQIAFSFISDKYPPNRILALEYFHQAKNPIVEELALQLLLDRNGTVRSFARNIISKGPQSGFDFRSFYINNLTENTVPALYGLSETGKLEDAPLAEPYLTSAWPKVLQACLVCLMRLDEAKYRSLLPEKFESPVICIIKTAHRLLLKYGVPDHKQIFRILQDTPYEYTRLKCISLLLTSSKWERLIYMFEALACPDEKVQALALSSIQNWSARFNNSFAQVTPQQREKLYALLSQQKTISPAFEKQLRFLIK